MLTDLATANRLPDRVVVINDTSSSDGGTAALALLSLRLLVRRGIAVTLICGDTGDNPDLAALGVEVIAAGQAPLLDRPLKDAALQGIHNRHTAALVADVIARRDTPGTVYHLHGWAQILSPSVFAALTPVAARSYIHAHDMFIACPNGVFMDYRRGEVCHRHALGPGCIATNCDKRAYHHKLWRVARQTALRRAFDRRLPWAGVLQLHPGMQPRLARGAIPERLVTTLRNPAAPWCTTRVRAEDNRGLLFVGRLEPDKGAGHLARAASRTGTAVTFVGDGSQRAEIAAMGFKVTGWLTPGAIAPLAKASRALVMPSLHPEPFSLVLPEAIHSGLPVLVADTALMAGEIVDRRLGIGFDPNSDSGIDAALGDMTGTLPDQIRDMSRRGFETGDRLALSETEWGDALVSLYQAVLE